MSVPVVPDVVKNVEMNDSIFSKTTIPTKYLGPCLALLLKFKYYGKDSCVLTHYTFSIKENKSDLFGNLIEILKFLLVEMEYQIPADKFRINNQCYLAMGLVVAGGDSVISKSTHDALPLLNTVKPL
jgi:hypothetical protein